jgi:hypothetical protein
MASLGFPVIAFVSSHSTAEHRDAWEIQVRAPRRDDFTQDEPQRQVTQGQYGRSKSISVTIDVPTDVVLTKVLDGFAT